MIRVGCCSYGFVLRRSSSNVRSRDRGETPAARSRDRGETPAALSRDRGGTPAALSRDRGGHRQRFPVTGGDTG